MKTEISPAVVGAFVIYHLAHFTWGFVLHDYWRLEDAAGRHDVYGMVVRSFGCWWVSASYLAAMALLALHLCHGIPSFFQTIGLHHSKYACAIKLTGPAIAGLIFLGYASLPVACWLGIVKLAEGAR